MPQPEQFVTATDYFDAVDERIQWETEQAWAEFTAI